MCELKGVLITILVTVSCSCCSAFNLDTKFPVIYKGSKGSYFGYTTALHKNRWGYLALVGAPKANTTTFLEPVFEPGTLYRCNVTRKTSANPCEEVFLMQEGAIEYNPRYDNAYTDKKDSMWLGVSLGVRPDSSENDIITCGHLWKNQHHYGQHLVNGVCYVINGDLDNTSIKKLLPLTRRALQYGRNFDGSSEYGHALGQVGISLAFSEDGSNLVLGAPGIWSWTGSIVVYGLNPDYSNDIYRNPITPHPPYEVRFSSYFGYSVATGKFFEGKKEYFAVGAPRDGYNGKVYIVRSTKGESVRVHQKKQGAQMGEYFGASVLGINLNADSFTDLLVGAPLYSVDSAGDEGKVYVYISNGKDLQKYAELTGDRKESARFGTALANIGDLNQDGYSDVAVGAPYEDRKGAVYIYHGSRSGMKTNYAQKVEASSLNSRLAGFGIHISRGMDIDNNGYPDILIGAYVSSNAVLLRSRPIIRVYPELTFTPKRIVINQTTCNVSGTILNCVRVDACLWYSGKHVPSSLDFHFTVTINDPRRRAFFTEKKSRSTGLNMVLDIGTKICSQFQLYLHEDIKDMDVFTPISIEFSHDLVQPKNFDKHFNETFPIYHPNSLRNITSEIPFHTGCDKDDECYADLVVSATRTEPEEGRVMTLGTFRTITVQVTVKNVKEPAYLAELLIDIPPELPTIKYDYFCDVGNQQNNASLVCNLGNPLRNGSQIDINVKLDATKIPPHTKYLEIICRAVTLSTESNPDDNMEIVPIHLETKADIGITGIPSDNQVLYNEETEISPVIFHTYTIRNHGPSPLDNINILLNIPYRFVTLKEKKQFVTFTAIEKDSGTRLSIPATCGDSSLNLTEVQPSMKYRPKDDRELFLNDKENFSSFYTSRDTIDASSDLILLSDVEPKLEFEKEEILSNVTSSKVRGLIVINCDRPDVECILLRCSATAFTNSRKFAQISVGFELNFTVLDDYLGSWYRAEYVTVGYISVSDPTVVQIDQHPNSFEVKTMLLHEGVKPPPEELAPWIIFVSVGVGVLLLVLILILLIKVGFFRRKEKDMMKEMLYDAKKGEENPAEIEDSDVPPPPQ